MSRLSVIVDIPAEAKDFFETYTSRGFEAFVTQRMGMRTYKEVERREENGLIHRRVRVVPEIQLPKHLRRVADLWLKEGQISYHERHILDPEAMRVDWRIEPPVLADKQDIHGWLLVEPEDEELCQVRIEGWVGVQVMGLGKLVAELAVREFKKRYRALPDLFEEWLDLQEED